jgi:hypothetical protein
MGTAFDTRWRQLRGRLDSLDRYRPAARLAARAAAVAWLVFFWAWLVGVQPSFGELDADAYWGLNLDTLYQGTQLGDEGAFLYSPPVAYLFAPFSALPFQAFYALLAAVNLGVLVWLLGPSLAALSLFLIPVSNEIARGNIHLLLAAAIVIGFKYAGSWAWVILTKVTPGIGVFWFALRREWRSFWIALGVTAAIVGVTFTLNPGMWFDWFAMLQSSVGLVPPSFLEIPLVPRLVVAGLVLVVAARRDEPVLVPVAALLALPAIWVNSLALLVAVVPLWRMRRERQAAADSSEGVLVPVEMAAASDLGPVPANSRISIRK